MTTDETRRAMRDLLLAHEPGADYGYETMLCTCGWLDADTVGLRQVDPESKTWPEHILRMLDALPADPPASADAEAAREALLALGPTGRLQRRGRHEQTGHRSSHAEAGALDVARLARAMLADLTTLPWDKASAGQREALWTKATYIAAEYARLAGAERCRYCGHVFALHLSREGIGHD